MTLERIRSLDAILPTLAGELRQRVVDPASGDRRLVSDAIESPTVIEVGRGWLQFQTTLSGASIPLAPLDGAGRR
jgi:hypothetical protein